MRFGDLCSRGCALRCCHTLKAQTLHAARVGVDDLNIKAARVVQNFTALRQAARQSGRQPAAVSNSPS